ncbi:hypothetical protein JK386_15170 [Nocardioides sp. zg-536]|uniref:Uncharacterized protein n=1 Tax=Nocardioides faecalis TaxID=2803858 RepID=A0A938Y8P8_9ACTN|nr:hypothetical protein [Nocardioides faecalis]MBM9461242.1 hypothetical protein [Nocardioides faecalis]MBS4752453.1 hypothetical protein [Nocardioides faecalis]QVI57736.1 hypothetical protein KG111_11725 [Nocardioides faecalis]
MAVQGLTLVLLSVLELASVSSARLGLGLSTAGFLAAYGVLLLAAGWGLRQRLSWTRGPVLLTQLISLGLAWNVREHAVLAIALLVTALVVLAGMLHRDTIEALER